MKEAIQSFLEQTLVPVLKLGFDPWHAALNALPPSVWRMAVCLYLLVGCLWTLRLNREFVFRGAPDAAPWRDLRVWVALLVVPYVAVYLIF
ncbi:MAG: hypothetical protein KF833_18225 [Verrucomicrobiae bacterium]|nr:hypothetical protein [Verrucomicrobiae bacterium]